MNLIQILSKSDHIRLFPFVIQSFEFITAAKLVRTLPNTPMQVGEGCTIYSPGSYVTQHDLEKVHLLLNSLGLAQQVPEKMINAMGAITGSGPAFVSIYLLDGERVHI